MLDGTGVPVTAKEAAGRAGKGEDGRAGTREVKLAVFFTQDTCDQDGYLVRDPGSSSYLATFAPAATFADLVEAEGIRRGGRLSGGREDPVLDCGGIAASAVGPSRIPPTISPMAGGCPNRANRLPIPCAAISNTASATSSLARSASAKLKFPALT